ncbi:histone deacetylase [Saxophila tyrrhenica]|uniref:Histone deacetylase n=1 Tax=Saxophila tyrrhenica TaxID=1690608 RepID=A0AAV9NUA1_9PEZI|nr:histone deacetylase [Saxophila tyrrhenica]
MPEYEYAYGKHDHHKGIFFVATIVTVGLCSLFPAMCFKSFSAKEKARKRAVVQAEKAEAKARSAQKVADIQQDMAPPSTPSTSLVEATRSTRQQTPEVQRRGGFRPELAAPSVDFSRQLRSPAGSGASAASSRQSSAEAVPSQLVGRRAGTDAYGAVSADSHDFNVFISDAVQHDNDTADELPSPMLLSPTWNTRPKVVEDSAIPPTPTPFVPTPGPPTSASSNPSLSPPLISLRSPFSSRKVPSSPTQIESGSSRGRSTTPQPVTASLYNRSPPLSPPSPMSQPRSAFFEGFADRGARDAPRQRQPAAGQSRTSSSHSPMSPLTRPRPWQPQTPPEAEPRSPAESTPTSHRHYFRTFSNDMIKRADAPGRFVTAPSSPIEPNETTSQQQHVETYGSDGRVHPASPNKNKRKRSGVLERLRSNSQIRNSVATTPNSVGASSASHATPDIRISSPGLAKSRRKSSISSYFSSRPRLPNLSAANTPSPAASPGLSTHWEDVLAEGQDRRHVKDPSDPLSPFTMPARRAKPTLRRSGATLRFPEADRTLPAESIAPVVPSGAAVGPQPKYKAADGQEYYKTSVTGPNASVNFLPSEMKRVDTPPVFKKKPTGFKGFFFDMRNTSSTKADPESPEAALSKRRGPIVSKASLQSLVPKLSFPKLKSQSSRQSTSARERSPDDRLRVTQFEQTPYSQRYGDARRAKRNQIRTYVEEALGEEDAASESANNMPFELNVPDHLPGSPLCPLSPKHKSGGKAICPIHGRKRNSKALDSPRVNNDDSGKTQPLEDVSDGMDEANGVPCPPALDVRQAQESNNVSSTKSPGGKTSPLLSTPATPSLRTPTMTRQSSHPATSPLREFSPNPPATVRRASSAMSVNHRPSTSPGLRKKTSRASLGAQQDDNEKRPTPKRSISNLITGLREAHGKMESIEEPVPLTAPGIAVDHFARELIAHSQPRYDAETMVILHDACYGHRYSRLKITKSTLSMIVERPERIHASVLGASTAYVRLGGHHSGDRNAPHPDIREAAPPPFKIRRTGRALDITSSYVTNVHGTAWMSELKGMCEVAGERVAAGAKELSRAEGTGADAERKKLHEGDLYLSSESLHAFQGALGGVADAVDGVFSPATQTKRAFVAVRPPGHHCSADHPSGFCWLNNVHVGIEYAAQTYGLTHAAMLDFDLHHGDGSQAITWQRNSKNNEKRINAKPNSKLKLGPDIGYYSLHDINSYPCEMGDDEKVQAASLCIDNAHGQSIWNVHLEEWKTMEDFWRLYEGKYRVLLEKARGFLRHHTVRLRREGKVTPKAAIFISAGFDASEWEGAGMQRHKVNVPTEFYARFTRDVVEMAQQEDLGCDGRVISVLEGGYSDRALCSGVLSHLSGLCATPSSSVKQEAANDIPLDQMMRGLGINGASAFSKLSYDPSWWSAANLTALELKVNPPPPAQAKKMRVGQQPTYATPTESFAYKVVDTDKFARSISGTMRDVARPVRPPTPPPPEVDWVIATQELSKLLIPTDRQTKSCTPEELAGPKTQKPRVSAMPAISLEDSAKPRQLRDRKAKGPAGYAASSHSDELESVRSVSRSSRRQTIADFAAIQSEPPPEPAMQRRASRRLSAGSTLSSIGGDLDPAPPPVPSLPVPDAAVPQTNGAMKPPPPPAPAVQVKKTRAPAAPAVARTKKAAGTSAPVSPQSKRPGLPTPAPSQAPPPAPAPSAETAQPTANGPADLDALTTGMKKITLKVGTKEEHDRKQKEKVEAERRARGLKAAETRRVNAAARKAAAAGAVVAVNKPPETSAASPVMAVPAEMNSAAPAPQVHPQVPAETAFPEVPATTTNVSAPKEVIPESSTPIEPTQAPAPAPATQETSPFDQPTPDAAMMDPPPAPVPAPAVPAKMSTSGRRQSSYVYTPPHKPSPVEKKPSYASRPSTQPAPALTEEPGAERQSVSANGAGPAFQFAQSGDSSRRAEEPSEMHDIETGPTYGAGAAQMGSTNPSQQLPVWSSTGRIPFGSAPVKQESSIETGTAQERLPSATEEGHAGMDGAGAMAAPPQLPIVNQEDSIWDVPETPQR